MKIALFYHSVLSDWNHGNAHFLRGFASELLADGHEVDIHEPVDGWSLQNLLSDHGTTPVKQFHRAYPSIRSHTYDPAAFDPAPALHHADMVIVHEWNPPHVVEHIGRLKSELGFVLLFHDTHHRMVTEPESMTRYNLSNYDGVLAFGKVLRDLYLSSGLARRAWIWHEAADAERFKPDPSAEKEGDLVWIGNWGDDERGAELHEYLIEPVRELGLKAAVYGVRYPQSALAALAAADIEYRGWLPNFLVPKVFHRFHLTVHVPRRPYVEALPGIPTIRPFEALACGIPLVSAPWDDTEHLFSPGRDFLIARDGAEMKARLRHLAANPEARANLASHGRDTILHRHTCAHRVDQLMDIYQEIIAAVPSRAQQLATISS